MQDYQRLAACHKTWDSLMEYGLITCRNRAPLPSIYYVHVSEDNVPHLVGVEPTTLIYILRTLTTLAYFPGVCQRITSQLNGFVYGHTVDTYGLAFCLAKDPYS